MSEGEKKLSGRNENAGLLFDVKETHNLRLKIEELQPVPGYCIMVDMVASTAAKDAELSSWLSRTHDCFALVKSKLSNFTPLKSMGDALMYYIRESELRKDNGNPLKTIFLPLCFAIQEPEKDMFGRTKIAVAYCQHAYEVTFLKDTYDIYGKDIDLTARLLSVASEEEIVMNEPFVEQVRADFKESSIQSTYPDVPRIKGPWPQRFKGFEKEVHIYKLPRGGTSLSNQPQIAGVY
jgi:class 3 adenylate cyclase